VGQSQLKIKILHQNCDPTMAQDKTLPYTAYLVEYHDGDKVCYDIASAPKTVDLFDYYWDNYKHGFKKWTQTEGRVNPKMWNPPGTKKEKGK